MSRFDRDRWDKKYSAHNPNPSFAPDPLLEEHAYWLSGRGLALDLACGVGHNAMYLARRGFEVMAIDLSLTGLYCGRAALAGSGLPVLFVAADLDDYMPAPGSFDLVTVFRFWSRALVPRIKSVLRPGGMLIYQTFNVNQLRQASHMRREYLLEPGELAGVFADLETLATNDSANIATELTYWIGRRPR